jgi:hypothetical protein
MAKIAKANKKAKELGVILDTDPRYVAKSGGAQDVKQNAAVQLAANDAAQA